MVSGGLGLLGEVDLRPKFGVLGLFPNGANGECNAIFERILQLSCAGGCVCRFGGVFDDDGGVEWEEDAPALGAVDCEMADIAGRRIGGVA